MTSRVQSQVDSAERVAVITTSFDSPVDGVWSLFSGPTKLARWWGPPLGVSGFVSGPPTTAPDRAPMERHDAEAP